MIDAEVPNMAMGTKIDKTTLAALCPLTDDAPYVCVIRYEDGTGSVERRECISEAVALRDQAESGLSAMLSVAIFARLV